MTRTGPRGVWFDEGVIDSEIVGNYFVNVPVAIFNEVSSNNLIASNIVAGAGIGIHVSGSNDTRVWNNTVSILSDKFHAVEATVGVPAIAAIFMEADTGLSR